MLPRRVSRGHARGRGARSIVGGRGHDIVGGATCDIVGALTRPVVR